MKPLVSVCIITYNQEKFIAQAIGSALMQQTSFDFEIVVCDDHSMDKTPEIIQAYAQQHPEKIKVYPAASNLGMLRNWERALKLCTGKYIALLEGDDYWVDAHKLQKQVAILEANPACAISFTNATIQYEGGGQGYPTYVTLTGEKFTMADLAKYNFLPTCSVVMRNNISDTFFHPAYFKSPFADWIIHTLNTQYGYLHFLNEFTCVYRVHSTGVWGGLKEEQQLLNKLKAINCVGEIVTDTGHQQEITNTRRQILQKICAFYSSNHRIADYIKYRTLLLFN